MMVRLSDKGPELLQRHADVHVVDGSWPDHV